MAYAIEKNVPAPAFKGRKKYPFPEMKVGDSFYADHVRVRSAATNWGIKHGAKFSIRVEADGFRIWRIA